MHEKNPPISVETPEHLSVKSQELWAIITAEKVTSPTRQALLLAALEARDRAEAARLAIAQQGMVNVTETTGAIHLNPLLKCERESKALFAKIWGQLGLDSPLGEQWSA